MTSSWNFIKSSKKDFRVSHCGKQEKYLIDKDGNPVEVVPPRVRPDDEKIVKWITGES